MPHLTLNGGHFLQEDSSTEFALAINQLLEKSKYRSRNLS
jgi:haloalkane dehalogenase